MAENFNFYLDIFQPYILPAIGMVITALITWAGSVFIKWLSTKIKNKELLALATTITTVAQNAVKATYQTFVESIKGTAEWNEETQKQALESTLATIKSELTTEALAYIESQHGDIMAYLRTLVESILYDLKNGKKIAVATEQA